jgi:hypothetical protein
MCSEKINVHGSFEKSDELQRWMKGAAQVGVSSNGKSQRGNRATVIKQRKHLNCQVNCKAEF